MGYIGTILTNQRSSNLIRVKMKKRDVGKLRHKINQIKKRLTRSRDNEGHSTPLKDRIRLKRLKELQKEVRNGDTK